MAITTADGIVNALGGAGTNRSKLRIDKASLTSVVLGQTFSLWRAGGLPAQAAAPTAPEIPTKATLGAMDFINQTLPARSYFLRAELAGSQSVITIEVGDRVAHMGGLNLSLVTSQLTTGMDLATLGLVAARLGAANYSDIDWYLECYADGGATASNATINVTYNDATTGNLNVVAVGGTLRAGRRIALNALRPDFSKFIKGINSVILSASTAAVGNFGFTAVNRLIDLDIPTAPKTEIKDWAQIMEPVPNDACLELAIINGSSGGTGTLRGIIIIGHG